MPHLEGPLLDQAVATLLGYDGYIATTSSKQFWRRTHDYRGTIEFRPSLSWADAGPLINDVRIGLGFDDEKNEWVALIKGDLPVRHERATTAAMQAFVAHYNKEST